MKETRKEMQDRISHELYYRNMAYVSPSEATQIASNLKTIEREANRLGVGRGGSTELQDAGVRVIAELLVGIVYAVIMFLFVPLCKFLFKLSKPFLKKVLSICKRHPYLAVFSPAILAFVLGLIYIFMTF